MKNQKPEELQGSDAVDLWLAGRDSWNQWVEKYPVANVSFQGVDFSEHLDPEKEVSFAGYNFPKGNVLFSSATFGEGTVYFSHSKFGKGMVFFEDIIFKGNADFSDLEGCDSVLVFSFRNVAFEKIFKISGKFGCVVDLVGTKTSHHVELSGLTCRLRRKRLFGVLKIAVDAADAARLRRLKELAQQNKHHEAGLSFHADEMRAKRWHETGKLASCLDILFSAVSDYGQSIWRPVAGLVLLTLVFAFLPNILSEIWELLNLPLEKKTLKIAISDSLPFIPASRSTEIRVTSILHQLLAVIFIFLIGLGLRNRFRI